MTSLVEKFQAWNASEEERHKTYLATHLKREEAEKAKVRSFLDGKDISNFQTNGYVYQFDYKGFHVIACNQDTRLVGEMYKSPSTEAERSMLQDVHMLEHSNHELFCEILDEYKYKSLCIDGSFISGISQVLRNIDKETKHD